MAIQETSPSARGVGLEKQRTLNSNNSKQMSSSKAHTATQGKGMLLLLPRPPPLPPSPRPLARARPGFKTSGLSSSHHLLRGRSLDHKHVWASSPHLPPALRRGDVRALTHSSSRQLVSADCVLGTGDTNTSEVQPQCE